MRLTTLLIIPSLFLLARLLRRALAAAAARRELDRAEESFARLVAEGHLGLPWDTDILGTLSMPIETRAAEVGLGRLTEVEATIAGPLTARALLGNGGFGYWHGMYDREATLVVADAFARLDLTDAAALMRDSMAVFPNHLPPDDRAARRRFIEANTKVFQDLPAERIFELGEELNKRLLRHVRLHRAALVAAHPAIAKALERLDALDARLPGELRGLADQAPASLDRAAFDALVAERDYTAAARALGATANAEGASPAFVREARELAAELHIEDEDDGAPAEALAT